MSSPLVKSLERMKESRRREFLELLKEFTAGLPGQELLSLRPEAERAGRLSTALRDDPSASAPKAKKRSI